MSILSLWVVFWSSKTTHQTGKRIEQSSLLLRNAFQLHVCSACVLQSGLQPGEDPPLLTPPQKAGVYISYARDNSEHAGNVVAFASWLRDQGIMAVCDLYFSSEVSQNPPSFIESQMNSAAFVIVICSPSYFDCWQISNTLHSINSEDCPAMSGQFSSKLDLTMYEIFLIRTILFQPGHKRPIIPVQLVKQSMKTHLGANCQRNTVTPVPLQGFRLYKFGSLAKEDVLDQRDLLYRLHGKPLYELNPPQ